MRKTIPVVALMAALVALLAATSRAGSLGIRARDVLPPKGLVASSVAVLRDQAALDAHYYLADEDILGLSRTTDAVFARYKTGTGEALLLVAAYPDAEEARRVYERFGEDFFSEAFDPAPGRFVENIETDDWAGAARKGSVLIVVLESPDRASCEDLLRRAEGRVPAAKIK